MIEQLAASITLKASKDVINSLTNEIHLKYSSLEFKPMPCHRLDRNTYGLVIFAKNEYVQECLVKQMKSNTFMKEYIAKNGGNEND